MFCLEMQTHNVLRFLKSESSLEMGREIKKQGDQIKESFKCTCGLNDLIDRRGLFFLDSHQHMAQQCFLETQF